MTESKLETYKKKEERLLRDICSTLNTAVDSVYYREGSIHVSQKTDIVIYEIQCFYEQIPINKFIIDKAGRLILREEYFRQSNSTDQEIYKPFKELISGFPRIEDEEIEIWQEANIIFDNDSKLIIDSKEFSEYMKSYLARVSIDKTAEQMRGGWLI